MYKTGERSEHSQLIPRSLIQILCIGCTKKSQHKLVMLASLAQANKSHTNIMYWMYQKVPYKYYVLDPGER